MVNIKLKMSIIEKFGNQGNFAAKIGLSEHKISRFVNCREIPLSKVASKISAALGFKVSDIFSHVLQEREVLDVNK